MKNLSKRLSFLMALLMIVTVVGSGVAIADDVENVLIVAKPNASTVLVNGAEVEFESYNINDNNYFKLRDLAKILNGSEKQFEVTWNSEAKAIELVSNTPYTEVGGELAAGDGEEKEAALNSSTIYKDEVEVELLAYTINDNNYFKLRDVAEAFDIGVTWDGLTKTVGIDTSIGYEAEESTEPVEEAEEAAEPVEELEEPAEEIEAEEEALVTIKSASIVIDPAGIVVEFDGPIPASLAGESYASLYYPDYHKDYVYSPFEMSPAPWEIGFSLDLVEGATEYTISLSGEGYEEYEWPGTGKYELSLLDQVINLELTEDSLQ